MPKLRVLRTTGGSPVAQKLQVVRVSGSGTTPAAKKLRVARITGTGDTAVVVNPLPNMAGIEPESVNTVTATMLGGSVADTWAWRVVSGPAATIYGTGATVNITAPSHINGTTITIGVRATVDSVVSPEVMFTVTSLPQTEWWWAGTGWIPKVEWWNYPPGSFGEGLYGDGLYGG